MTDSKPPAPPAGLDKPGRALWRSIVGGWELDARELALLAAAARQADDIAALEALLERDGLVVPGSAGQPRLNAVVTEVRQARQALAKLLEGLSLPEQDGQARVSRRQQLLAHRRWSSA